jgi:streptogramin lyase
MKRTRSRKPARSKRPASKRRPAAARARRDPLLAPMAGATHREVAGVTLDIVPAANGRVKRVCYPPGFRWSTHMQPLVKTGLCMHAHVGFLARGHVRGTYSDGCAFDLAAPRAVVLEPGHDAWVVGKEPAVLIEFDTERTTAERFGLPATHRH